MKVPQLKKKLEIKTCHNIDWEDNYSWIHQKDILEVLKDKSKLDPEVKKYLEDENAYTDHHLKDTKDIQKKLFTSEKSHQCYFFKQFHLSYHLLLADSLNHHLP